MHNVHIGDRGLGLKIVHTNARGVGIGVLRSFKVGKYSGYRLNPKIPPFLFLTMDGLECALSLSCAGLVSGEVVS